MPSLTTWPSRGKHQKAWWNYPSTLGGSGRVQAASEIGFWNLASIQDVDRYTDDAPSMANPFPAPSSHQSYVTVSPLAAGFITLPDSCFVKPDDAGGKRTVPSLAFLITHPGTKAFGLDGSQPSRIMFDLGLRRSRAHYSKSLQKHLDGRTPYQLEPGVAAQLRAGGLDPSRVDLVILSHVHYDHHGDPEDFLNAQFWVGHGAMDVLEFGLGGRASHQQFEAGLLPKDRCGELSDPRDDATWKPLGPFPATLDLFADGSLYVIDMPGHLPGHVNLLCRTNERWVLLCGDAFHDRRLLTGEKQIGTWESPYGTLSIHADIEVAAKSIARLREFDRLSGEKCELIAAHDDVWWEQNKSRSFPNII